MISLDKWVDTAVMESHVELENARLKDDRETFGNKGRCFREAWVAVKFAKPFGATHVFLPINDRKGPDFRVKRDQVEHAFQTVEVLTTSRRRGAEEWNGIKHVSQKEMEDAYNDIPAALDRAVNGKLGKYVPKTLSLVVYFNTSAYVFEHERLQVEQWIIEETKPCVNEFISVFILRDGLIFEHVDGALEPIELESVINPRCHQG